VTLFRVIALQFVQDLDEDFQDRRTAIPADGVRLLVDVEQDAARGNPGGAPQIGPENFILDVRQQQVGGGDAARQGLVVEHQRQDFQQVRLARAKETRNPNPVGVKSCR